MIQYLNCKIQQSWYGQPWKIMWPLQAIYKKIIDIRKWLYQNKWLATRQLDCPVIVVGNITVGGTGKTPLVLALVDHLQQAGISVGIVSRGYQSKLKGPIIVPSSGNPKIYGDEAVLMAQNTRAPVAIAKRRIKAARLVKQQFRVDVIIADDGLQHYALGRNIEIAVIDGERKFGNGYLLPMGPLRELPERLSQVQYVVENLKQPTNERSSMVIVAEYAINLVSGQKCALSEFAPTKMHAVAGIGNPQRFFEQLTNAGIDIIPHAFPDHYDFRPVDVAWDDPYPVIMTEKDVVKCRNFATRRMWFLPVKAQLNQQFVEAFIENVKELTHHG